MKLSLFTRARLKLTFWYVLTIMLIAGSVSLIFYVRTASILDIEYERIERRLQQEWPRPLRGQGVRANRLLPEDVLLAKSQIRSHLLLINGLIMFIVAAAGYLLSGLTLKPVEIAHEDQKRFIADAAHELKTPITAIKTGLEVKLMDKKLSSRVRCLLGENLQDVNRLQKLVQQLLQLSNSTETIPQFERIALGVVVNAATQIIKPLASKGKVKVEIQGIDADLVVYGDQGLLTDLLVILLDNAIKYSPKNSMVLLKSKRLRSRIQLQVSDKGKGIAKKDREHIFERFYRVDTSRTRTNGDSFGLGLAIAKKIVEQHHGSIEVQSEVAKGTTFTVSLPRLK